jgi:[ribosomal protein S18]-alanine N-acetyltransferase
MTADAPLFRLRAMEGRDIPAVVALDRQVFRDAWPESAYVQEIYFNPSAHYFVLELLDLAQSRRWYEHRRRTASRLIGFVGMRVEGTRGHISTLALRPEWRGHRLGEFLLLVAITQAIADGASVLGLEVRVSNTVAQRLYEKYAFEQQSRLRGYYADGEDAYYLQVQLKDNPQYCTGAQTRYATLLDELQVRRSADKSDGSQ